MKNNPLLQSLTLACSLSLGALTPAVADVNDSIEQALKFGQPNAEYGQVKLNLSYRYEFADIENTTPKPANANLIRLRLGYLTPEIFHTQAFAEYENVFALQNDYNGGGVYGSSQYHNVVDPADRHELNQLWITFKGIPDTVIKGGRQRIKLDDDRFIGNVGWRLMEQTYDAVMVTNQSIKDVTIKAGYIGRIRNIKSLTDNIDAPFVNINHKLGAHNIIAYGYWLDYRDDPANLNKSSQSYGLRLIGSPQYNEDITFHYTAEYTFQSDYGSSNLNYEADRYNLMAGISVYGITFKGAMEQLDGNNGAAFTTPLGTNHAFQGWADRFLVTPTTGLRDINASVSTKLMGTKLMFVYHKFQDDTSRIDYADEYDFLLVHKFGKHYSLLAKYAYYDGDDNAPGAFKNNSQKVWVQATVSF
jgi:hypothetical protein